MKQKMVLAAHVLAVIGLATLAAPALAQQKVDSDSCRPEKMTPELAQRKIEIAYCQPNKPEFKQILDRLRKRQVLETLQKFLSPLKLDRPLIVRTAECGTTYSPYVPGGPVTICYEYVDQIESVMPGEKGLPTPKGGLDLRYLGRLGPLLITREMATVGPFVQHVLHETALAVFDRLEVPIWGRREDAADYVAAFLLFQFGTDVSRKTILGTAYFLNESDRINRAGVILDANYLGDIRPTVRQRYYNILCIALGKDPIGFSTFIAIGRPPKPEDLPINRIKSCRGTALTEAYDWTDYGKVSRAFGATILPLIDQKLMNEVVSNTKWIPDE